MAQEPHLDDRYTSGVWYDAQAGEFCTITRLDDTIGLCEPDRDEPYYTFDEEGMTKEEAIESINQHFRPVSDEAVEDPARILRSALRRLQRNDINELAGVPFEETVDINYARTQVEIVEK